MQDSDSWREKVARIIYEHILPKTSETVPLARRTEDFLRDGPNKGVWSAADAIAALSPAPEGWREALEKCAQQFRSYERQHRDKGPSGIPKAEVNEHMAIMCESLLSASPLPVGGGEERDSGSDVAADKAPVSPQERHTKGRPA